MPINQFITVLDRPTYQTEKVKGFDRVRMFKGSATTSPTNNSSETELITIISGQYVFNALKDTYQSNYKGTNFIANSSTLEDFDSFILKANGVAYCSGFPFGFRFDLLDSGGSTISGTRVDSYYGIGANAPGTSGGSGEFDWFDWYMEVEFTFYRDNGTNFLVLNGNLSYATKNNSSTPYIFPICGTMNAGTEPSFYIDFAPVYSLSGISQNLGLKSLSLEFVE